MPGSSFLLGFFYFMPVKFICQQDDCDFLEADKDCDLINIRISKIILQDGCDIQQTLGVSLEVDEIKLLITFLKEKIKLIEGGKNG